MLTGTAAWNQHYASWEGASGLGDKLSAVVVGSANILGSIKIVEMAGITLMGVFIASFAGTTLDTTVRIQRYVISELANDLKMPFMSNKWTATTFAVITAAALAFVSGADGKGAMALWPLFGSVNQLLAALALLVITMYLKKKGGMKYIVTAIPCVLMLVITCWAMVVNEIKFYKDEKWLLVIIGGGIFVLSIWMVAETITIFFKKANSCSIEHQSRQAQI
jgi:carbon starvation protein